MKKAIATVPSLPTEYVELTDQDNVQRARDEAAWKVKKVARANKEAFALSDADMTRSMEDLIDAQDAATKSRIPAETMEKYNRKKTLRLTLRGL